VKFESIGVPFFIRLSPVVESRSSSQQTSHLNTMADLIQTLSAQGRAECRVDGQRVTTFDEVHYRTPFSNCYTVLAKDCSEEGGATSPAFIVLIKENVAGGKKMKLVTRHETVEAERNVAISAADVDGEEKSLIVKINGQRVSYNAEALERPTRQFAAVRFTNVAKTDVEIHHQGHHRPLRRAAHRHPHLALP